MGLAWWKLNRQRSKYPRIRVYQRFLSYLLWTFVIKGLRFNISQRQRNRWRQNKRRNGTRNWTRSLSSFYQSLQEKKKSLCFTFWRRPYRFLSHRSINYLIFRIHEIENRISLHQQRKVILWSGHSVHVSILCQKVSRFRRQ